MSARSDLERNVGNCGPLEVGKARKAECPKRALTGLHSFFATQIQKVSEEEYLQILDLTPLFVTVLGPRRERLYINRIGLDYLGTTLDRWRDTAPRAELYPADLEPVKSHWDEAFLTGLPFECEFRARRHDGTYRWLLGRCNTVRDDAGQIRRWHAAFTDVDSRKRADEETRQAKAGSRLESCLDNTRLQRVLDHIAANFQDPIPLERLAEIAGYSTFHFARKFRLATGIPPNQYISRMRLENAKVELEAGALSLAEIAFNAHFSSQASFTRAFHRLTGTSPKKYQRSHR